MIVAKLKIDKVVDVDQILNKVVKEKKNVDLSTFYKRKISAVDKEIYIYSFECVVVKNSLKENAYSVLEIPFVLDNPSGSRFVELFSKNNFDKQKIKDFIKESNEKKNAENEIKSELSSSLALELLKKHFTEKYSDIDVEKILSEYNVSVSLKSAISSSIPVTASFIQKKIPANIGTKDNTQYMVNDAPTGGKCPTVYRAVQFYVESHKGISFSELQEAFPDYLAKPGFGKMVRRWEEVKPTEWSGNRFNKHPIILSDGTRVVVSTQWKPDNMQNFIEGIKKLGIETKPTSY